jgi:putative endonuclease
MYFVYVLYSLKDHDLYKGSTSNVMKRFIRHNSGGNASTARRRPFIMVHVEQFENKSDALKREIYLKSTDGHIKLKNYLKGQRILNDEGMLAIQ